MEYIIDQMQPQDWPQVADIYRAGIATKIATYELDAPSWEEWDAGHDKRCRPVARSEDQILGWASLCPFSVRHCYRGVAENSIYIDPAFAGMGVGKALLQALIQQAQEAGYWTLEAKIIRENEASLFLHRGCGFVDVGVHRRLGQMDNGKWHDVCILEYRSETVGMD